MGYELAELSRPIFPNGFVAEAGINLNALKLCVVERSNLSVVWKRILH